MEAAEVSSDNCQPHPDFEFQRELTTLINKHGIDARLSIPDFILCNHLLDTLSSLTNLKVSILNHELGGIHV